MRLGPQLSQKKRKMTSQNELKKFKQLEARVHVLEADSHPPVAWQQKINELEVQIKDLLEKLEKYGI